MFFLEGSTVTTTKTVAITTTTTTTSLAACYSHSSVHIQKKIPI
jgi:hypothetical protein